MRIEHQTSPEARAALYSALAAAQAAFPVIKKTVEVEVKTRTGSVYTFCYAPLDEILEAVRKPLADNGMALYQELEERDGGEYVRTILVHKDGAELSTAVKILVMDTGPKAYGSAQTYARRQGVTLLLCLAPEDDDDAADAEGDEQDRRPARGRQKPAQERAAPAETGEPPPDPEIVDQYARRIIENLDNQDPGGAALLYDEMTAAERMAVWRNKGLTMKHKRMIEDAHNRLKAQRGSRA